MPGHAYRKLETLMSLKVLLLQHPDGMDTTDIIAALPYVTYSTVYRNLHEIGAVQVKQGWWKYEPTEVDRDFAAAVMNWRQQ